MSLRAKEVTDKRRSCKAPDAKRLNAVLATGVLRTGGLVPKISFQPLTNDATVTLEQMLADHAQRSIFKIGGEVVSDLQEFDTSGYTHNDSQTRLADSVYIPMLGELTATLRISKTSEFMYDMRVNAFVANGPFRTEQQQLDTKLDLREMATYINKERERFRNHEFTNGDEGLDVNVQNQKEFKYLVEAVVGFPADEPELWFGPSTLATDIIYSQLPEISVLKMMLLAKVLIEIEKTYLTALLMMAYRPDQVLGYMNKYDATHLFRFIE